MKLAEDLRRSVLQSAVEGKLTGGSREGWRFVRLDEIVAKTIKRGKSPKYTPHSNTLVFAQKCNTKRGNIDLSLALYLDESTIGKYPEEEFMIDGDIVLNSTGRGTLGRVGQYRITDNPQNIPLVPDSHVTIIRIMKDISSEYICYVLKHYQPHIETLGEGSTNQTELSTKKIAALIIPLPPIDEQRRIVSRLDVILPLIAELESAENELEALERKFPGDMRESLLQAAIEGRLTGSNTNNWRFVRLGEIVAKTIKRGKSPKYVPHSNTLVFAQKCNTKQGNIDLSLALYLDESTIGKYPEEEFMIDGDIVLNSTGRGTLGRVGQYRITDNPQNISLVPDSHVTIIRLMKDISSEYIFYVLKNYQAYIETLGEGSTNQTELSAKKVANLLIPLPPLDEQQKIVSRLKELLPLCEAMKGE